MKCEGEKGAGGGGTERSIVEKDDIVEGVSESFVVGPDFTHRRLSCVRLIPK